MMSDIIEYLDPDWRDHFTDAEAAAEHYQRYSPAEWRRAYYDVTGEEWDTI